MIRILFTIVAVVAAILGVVLPMPELFFAAGLALVVTLALVAVRIHRRRNNHRQTAAMYAQSGDDDELSSLGILEIRPREKGAAASRNTEGASSHKTEAAASRRPEADAPSEPEGRPAAAGVDDAPVNGDGFVDEAEVPDGPADVHDEHFDDAGVGKVRPRGSGTNGAGSTPSPPSTISIKEKSQTVRAGVDEKAPDHYREVIVPYLQAFRAAIQAQTVCLLKQPIDNLHHQIEGIVSLNAYARSGGDFATKVPLVQTRDSRATTDIRRVAEDDFPPSGLGYYREAIAVKEIAVTAVPGLSTRGQYVLLADSMQEHGLNSDRTRSLMGHFARLLGALMDDVSGLDVLESYDYVRPRREIINEEIERARQANRPLALALVHLNRAESIADLGEREVKNEERALAAYLRKTARNARVERFGELTFGVFFTAKAAKVEKWATELQHELEHATGSLEGGVSIGIAVLQERHPDADSLRRDATDALREAYESGTCTIVE